MEIWRTTTPTQTGWYWCIPIRESGYVNLNEEIKPIIVYVECLENGTDIYATGQDYADTSENFSAWIGPLQIPNKP